MALLNGSFTGTMYYLSFDADGNMYMSSKEPKPGYVDKINPMTGVQNGYKKIIPYGISGYLNNMSIRPVKTNTGAEVPFLYLTFKDYENDEYYGFSFPVFQEGEKIHRYVKSFVKYYPNIDISRMLRFNSFKRKPEDEYAPSNLAIAYYNGETRAKKEDMIPMYYKKGQNGWPEAVKTVSKVSGKEMVSYEEQNAFAEKVDHPVRKTAHAAEYAVLGLLTAGAYIGGESAEAFKINYKKTVNVRDSREKMSISRGIVIPWVITTAYAGTDELHQLFVPGRSGQVSDVLLDSAGALIGLAVLGGMRFLMCWRRENDCKRAE